MKRRELSGRTALVTGVGRRKGIGAAIARELARGGARLFVTSFSPYDRQQTWGVDEGESEAILAELGAMTDVVVAKELDLGRASAAAVLFGMAMERLGRVDILVNNAAHWESGGLGDVDADQLDRHYAVNVRASVLLCAEFARRKKPEARGRIINITSGQNLASMPGEIAYVVTKAALDAMTLTLGTELAGQGITVNAVDPGPTDTGWISDDLRSSLLSRLPQGISAPEAIGRLVRLLAGDATASITGQVIRAQSSEALALLRRATD